MDSTDSPYRRRVLAGIGGTLLSLGLAGCTGGSGSTAADPAEGGGASTGDTTEDADGGSDDSGGNSIDEPDYGGWFDDVDNYESTVDETGSDTVTIEVGAGSNGYRFDPPAVAVSPGTTVVWEWTGAGGSHNVVADSGDFESEMTGETGYTFEQTFDSTGVIKYYCSPHKMMGMKGAVAVVE